MLIYAETCRYRKAILNSTGEMTIETDQHGGNGNI